MGNWFYPYSPPLKLSRVSLGGAIMKPRWGEGKKEKK